MSQPPPLDYQVPRVIGLGKIARAQRALLLTLAVRVFLTLGQFVVPDLARVFALAAFGVGILGAVYLYKLALFFFPKPMSVALMVVTLIPMLGLISMLIVSQRATTALQAAGLKVGLLGVNPKSIPSE